MYLTKIDNDNTHTEQYMIYDLKGSIPAAIINNISNDLLKEAELDVNSMI